MAIPQVRDPTVRYLSTVDAYDRWAQIYDTDGNFLQALDTIEMKKLTPQLLALLQSGGFSQPWKFVDLGCGTGRNTAALLDIEGNEVVGLDASPGMLVVARDRLQAYIKSEQLHLEVFDMLEQCSAPAIALGADAVVSTLVLEHIPVDAFFRHVTQILKPGGFLLLSNMHSDMGAISQAGFLDPQTGAKVRPTSYAHTVAHIKRSASQHGLEVVDRISERSVDADMVSQLGERSLKWVGVNVWVGGILKKVE